MQGSHRTHYAGASAPGVRNGHAQNPSHPAQPSAGELARTFYLDDRGGSGTVPPRPDPAAAAGPCSADRVVVAGGFTTQLLAHPSFVPLEFVFRDLPNEAVFSASSEQNFSFELGAIAVPSTMVLALCDFSFAVHRLQGMAAGDTIPLEPERLSTIMGYDLVVDEYRKGNLRFELDPVPISDEPEAYTPPLTAGTIAAGTGANPGGTGAVNITDTLPTIPQFAASSPPQLPTENAFNQANFVRSASPSGSGLSTLPQRRGRYGARDLPFTIFVQSNQRVSFRVVIFKPIPIPLAFFEVSAAGFFFPANVMADILACMTPSVSQGAGR